ncbi:MAG TPA: flagellar motor protein MotB, partial [Sphingomonadaceae bacterium]|nr:flagellar motor protein MotB [Sphingomonadaceae bacterium]
MRKLAMVLALSSTALATPVLARDGSFYIGVEGGAMIVEDLDL